VAHSSRVKAGIGPPPLSFVSRTPTTFDAARPELIGEADAGEALRACLVTVRSPGCWSSAGIRSAQQSGKLRPPGLDLVGRGGVWRTRRGPDIVEHVFDDVTVVVRATRYQASQDTSTMWDAERSQCRSAGRRAMSQGGGEQTC
jgi:hypothetical protein